MNQNIKNFWFFIACGLVLALGYADATILFGDDFSKIFSPRPYPLPKEGWVGHRLIDGFFARLSFLFYDILIAPILALIFGAKHFVDSHAHYALLLYALVHSGFILLALSYARLWVKITSKTNQLLFALIFFALFTEFFSTYTNLIYAYHLTTLLALGFLYPFVAYIGAKKDCFADWNQTYAVSGMMILAYLVNFSIFFSVVFTQIALFCLALFYILTRKNELDFSNPISFGRNLIERLPKWLWVNMIFSALLFPLYIYFALQSGRWARVVFMRENSGEDISERALSTWTNLFSPKGYDFMEIMVIGAVILCSLLSFFFASGFFASGFFASGLKTSKNWKVFITQKIDWQKTGKFFYLAIGFFVLAFCLYSIALFLLYSFATFNRRSFFIYEIWWLFIIAILVLVLGFRLIRNHSSFAPFIYFLFFIIASGGLHSLLQPKRDKKDDLRQIFNLQYTFNCYGEDKTYIHQDLGRYIPQARKNYSNWKKNGIVNKHINKIILAHVVGDEALKSIVMANQFIFASKTDIYRKLASLRKNKTWLCSNPPNPLYYVDVLTNPSDKWIDNNEPKR